MADFHMVKALSSTHCQQLFESWDIASFCNFCSQFNQFFKHIRELIPWYYPFKIRDSVYIDFELYDTL